MKFWEALRVAVEEGKQIYVDSGFDAGRVYWDGTCLRTTKNKLVTWWNDCVDAE